MNIYTGRFIDLQAAGQNIYTLKIYDRETPMSGNDFNLLFWVRNLGDGTQDVLFTWNSLRNINATNGIYVGYYDGSFHDTPVTRYDQFAKINIPEGDYGYYLYIDYATGLDVRYQPNAGQQFSLEMSDTPVTAEVVDSDEDTFTPIRGKRLNIALHTSSAIGLETFVEGGDNRFYVEYFSEAEGLLFCGFLSTEDTSEDFLPDPNVLQLTATDALAFLSDEPLTKFDGETPEYEHPIISFISWALSKTGMYLNIRACMNIREESAETLNSDADGSTHFYQQIFLNSKTFEADIGTCEDCRTVLEKILGEECELFQYRGEWVIRRVDEIEPYTPFYFFTFDYKGSFLSFASDTLQKNIGVGLPLAWMSDDAPLKTVERAYKQVIETYKYESWAELVCNQDFSRGDVISAPNLSLPTATGTYQIDCWNKQKFPANAPGDPNGGEILPADNDAYIERKFEYGYEKERYLVLTAGGSYDFEGVASQPINVVQGDKISVGVSWKLPSDVGAGMGGLSINVFSVYIVTPGGDWYYLSQYYQSGAVVPDGKTTWQGPYDGQRTQAIQYTFIPDQTDERNWVTISADAPAIPVAGKLYIGLWKVWQGSSLWNVNTHFSNLQITFTPFVNGSYARFNGQQHIVTNESLNTRAVREKDVYISDSPSLNFKGALQVITSYITRYTGNLFFFQDPGTGQWGVNMNSSDATGYYSGQRIQITSGLNTGIYTLSRVDTGVILVPKVFLYFEGTLTGGSDAGTVAAPNYALAGRFYSASVFPDGVPDNTYYHPYGEIQSFDAWNQFNRTMRIFEGVIDMTDEEAELPDILHKYVLTDQDKNAYISAEAYRVFKLLHFELNYHLCELNVFLRETVKTDVSKQYIGHEFKYLQENE